MRHEMLLPRHYASHYAAAADIERAMPTPVIDITPLFFITPCFTPPLRCLFRAAIRCRYEFSHFRQVIDGHYVTTSPTSSSPSPSHLIIITSPRHYHLSLPSTSHFPSARYSCHTL